MIWKWKNEFLSELLLLQNTECKTTKLRTQESKALNCIAEVCDQPKISDQSFLNNIRQNVDLQKMT